MYLKRKKKKKIKTLKVPLIVTDGLIFGTYYVFIFPSALIIHNYHHFTHTLSKTKSVGIFRIHYLNARFLTRFFERRGSSLPSEGEGEPVRGKLVLFQFL